MTYVAADFDKNTMSYNGDDPMHKQLSGPNVQRNYVMNEFTST